MASKARRQGLTGDAVDAIEGTGSNMPVILSFTDGHMSCKKRRRHARIHGYWAPAVPDATGETGNDGLTIAPAKGRSVAEQFYSTRSMPTCHNDSLLLVDFSRGVLVGAC